MEKRADNEIATRLHGRNDFPFEGTQYYIDLLGYSTHGDFIVMEAVQVMRGSEFPPR